jgi:hypothetical protein
MVQEANRMMDDIRQLNHRLIKMWDIEDETKTAVIEWGRLPKCIKKKQDKDIIHMKKYKDKNEVTNYEGRCKSGNWEMKEFREITRNYFMNSKKWYKGLFMKREKNLSEMQKLRLRQLLREFDYSWYLSEARWLKENFIEALDDREWWEIQRITQEALASRHYRTNTWWRTLRRWRRELENYCIHSTEEFAFTNAYTESMNNQSKICKRVSHWFRHKGNYLRKLTSRFVFDEQMNPKKSHNWE